MTARIKDEEQIAQQSKSYLTREQVKEKLQVSLPTVDKWTAEGILKGRFIIGGRVRYNPEILFASIEALRNSSKAA